MVVAEERPRVSLTHSFSKLFKDIGLSSRAVSTTFGSRVNVAICLQVTRMLSRTCVVIAIGFPHYQLRIQCKLPNLHVILHCERSSTSALQRTASTRFKRLLVFSCQVTSQIPKTTETWPLYLTCDSNCPRADRSEYLSCLCSSFPVQDASYTGVMLSKHRVLHMLPWAQLQRWEMWM